METGNMSRTMGSNGVEERAWWNGRHSARIRFSRIPFRAFYDSRLMKSPNYYRVLGLLCGHANKQNKATIYQHTLVNLPSRYSDRPISRSTVCRILRDLKEWGYIEIKTQRGVAKPCEYTILYATQDEISKCPAQEETFPKADDTTLDETFEEKKYTSPDNTDNMSQNSPKCPAPDETDKIKITKGTKCLTECVNQEETTSNERNAMDSSTHTHTNDDLFDFLEKTDGEELRDLLESALKYVSLPREADRSKAARFLKEEIFENGAYERADIEAGLLDFQAYCDRNGKGPYRWIKDRIERARRDRMERESRNGYRGAPQNESPALDEEAEQAHEAWLCEEELIALAKTADADKMQSYWNEMLSDKPFLKSFEAEIFEQVEETIALRNRVEEELRRRIETMKDRLNDPAFNVQEYIKQRQEECEKIDPNAAREHPLFEEYSDWYRRLKRRGKG